MTDGWTMDAFGDGSDLPQDFGHDLPPVWCGPDDCPATICNGPHKQHTCPNGDVVTMHVDDPGPCPGCGYRDPFAPTPNGS